MPALNINDDERNTVIAALHQERVRLTGEWSKDAEAHIFKGAVWHHEHGWLYTVNQLKAAVEAVEAGGMSKGELDRILEIGRSSVSVSQIADLSAAVPQDPAARFTSSVAAGY